MSMLLRFALCLCSLLPLSLMAEDDVAGAPGDVGEVVANARPSTLGPDWQQGPFIEIYVRGFQDSNGDGTGDLQGIIKRLDYLQKLGVRGIWLMPIYHSQDNNHGYTIRNFRKVEPRYGNEEDLRRLLDAAHQRGIGIILDYVINHSAEKHPLFISAENRESPYRDWYVCTDGPRPEGWKAFGDKPWVGQPGRWCYTAFSSHMRDFNLQKPEVLEFHLNNLRYWLNLGVDGFRFDAVGVLVENEIDAWENQPQNYRIMRQVRDVVSGYPNTYMVCEAPSDPVGFNDSCGHAFAFGLQSVLLNSVKSGTLNPGLRSYLREKPVARMGTFLSNHDGFAGIRIHDQLGGDLDAYRLAAAALFTLPGTPFVLYGEEVGMSMSRKAGYEDMQIRAPMSWNGEDKIQDDSGATFYTFGGFTRLQESWKKKLFRPQADNWREFNAAAQEADPTSLLNTYRQLAQLRQQNEVLRTGALQLLDARDATTGSADGADVPVLAFIRTLATKRVLVLHNFGRESQRIKLRLPTWKKLQAVWPATGAKPAVKKGKDSVFELAARQSLVWALE